MPEQVETVIPLYEETVSVGKRPVERGRVRVDVRVAEREQTLQQTLERRDVEVERVAINRVVESAPETRREGDVLIIPVVEEEVVMVKRLVLREEIHVRERTTQRTEQFTVNVRSEKAEISRDGIRQDASEVLGEKA
jgi:uncharacterized protein (TIGR02271 family)